MGLLLHNGKRVARANTGRNTASAVRAITVDKSGNLVFANTNGLNYFSKGALLTYTTNSGLPSKFITSRSVLIDQDNNLWCGTDRGLGFSAMYSQLKTTSVPEISQVESSNKANTTSAFVLTTELNDILQLNYVSPSFPGRLTVYQTQIVNFDKRWRKSTLSNELTISDLPQGTYQIKIRAKQFGNFGWSQPKTIGLEVTLPWYFSWWGVTSIVLTLGLAFYVGPRIVYVYQRKKAQVERLRLEKLVNARTLELTAQSEKLKSANNELEDYKNHLEDRVTQRTKELREEKERAEAANIAKTQFLANMSHEIRSPLNAIGGFSQILIQESKVLRLRQDFTRYLTNIKASSQNLSEIINNILDLSKIEADKMPLTEEAIALEQIFKGVYHIKKGAATEKNIHFTYEYDPTFPKYVLTDRTKINQILINVVTNAIKFTPQNKSVAMKAVRDRDTIRFQIIDEGVGIPESKLETIFVPFEQVDTSVTRKFGGTGLGLAITKKMVELMGGTIEVSSTLGKGSVFEIAIPLREADIFEGEEEYDLDTIVFSKNNVILVVEDNKMNQEMMEAFFKQLNLPMYLAENGEEGVRKTMELRPNLILMDMHMPVMDGMEATKQIRKTDEIKTTPIVAVSADAFQDQQKQALAIGIDGYITKPINFTKLMPYFIKYLEVDTKTSGTPTKKPQSMEVALDDLTEESQIALRNVLSGMKEIPIFNSKEILKELQAVREIFENNEKNTALLEKIEDAVYEGEEEDYQSLLQKIAV